MWWPLRLVQVFVRVTAAPSLFLTDKIPSQKGLQLKSSAVSFHWASETAHCLTSRETPWVDKVVLQRINQVTYGRISAGQAMRGTIAAWPARWAQFLRDTRLKVEIDRVVSWLQLPSAAANCSKVPRCSTSSSSSNMIEKSRSMIMRKPEPCTSASFSTTTRSSRCTKAEWIKKLVLINKMGVNQLNRVGDRVSVAGQLTFWPQASQVVQK